MAKRKNTPVIGGALWEGAEALMAAAQKTKKSGPEKEAMVVRGLLRLVPLPGVPAPLRPIVLGVINKALVHVWKSVSGKLKGKVKTLEAKVRKLEKENAELKAAK